MEIQFNGGDEIRQPFRVMVGDNIADLTGCRVSAKIIVKNGPTLTEGNGITIIDRRPEGDAPHGLLVISEDLSRTLPPGRLARLRFLVADAANVTVSSIDTYFMRIG